MKLIRAVEMGMCFGVTDALAIARAVPEPRRVTIHGELVHNEAVLAELDARGFARSGEAGRELPRTPAVLVTAHGVSEAERERLLAAGKELIDTTCPLVRFAHERARSLARDGCFVVVLGRRGHVEVRGLVGDLERYAVIEGEAEVVDWGEPLLGVVAQTTTRPGTAERLLAAIRAANPRAEVRFEDTICGPTRNRQAAMHDLLAQVEAVVVVGGRSSNNTLELVRLARSRGIEALHVQGPEDLDPAWLRRFSTLGLSAGTSTPAERIDAVERAILALAARASAAA